MCRGKTTPASSRIGQIDMKDVSRAEGVDTRGVEM